MAPKALIRLTGCRRSAQEGRGRRSKLEPVRDLAARTKVSVDLCPCSFLLHLLFGSLYGKSQVIDIEPCRWLPSLQCLKCQIIWSTLTIGEGGPPPGSEWWRPPAAVHG